MYEKDSMGPPDLKNGTPRSRFFSLQIKSQDLMEKKSMVKIRHKK